MRCRPATLDDAPAIAALHAASWRVAYRGALRDAYLDGDADAERLQVWTERLGTPAPNQYAVVAEDAGRLAGFACAFGEDDPRLGTQVDNLHVRREQQGRGTGRRLLATSPPGARRGSRAPVSISGCSSKTRRPAPSTSTSAARRRTHPTGPRRAAAPSCCAATRGRATVSSG